MDYIVDGVINQAGIENLQYQMTELQARLTLAEAKFAVIFHQAPDVILIINGDDGSILDVNDAIFQILGHKRTDLIGQHFSILLPPMTEEIIVNGWLEQLHIHGVAIEGQLFFKADGSTCPMDLTVKVVPWYTGSAVLATLRDVTDRTRNESAQQKLIQELNSFAQTVAHDLKAPLGVIVGAGEVLQDISTLKEKEAQQLAELIMRNGNKMTRIIEELLLLAQMRDEDVEVRPLDMTDIVTEARQRLYFSIQQRQAEITMPTEWPRALGYAPWIEEVWVNYISNALKYGGTPPRIQLGADETPPDMIRFWIRDNGPGLTLEEQRKLFNQFTRLDEIRAEGYGLGLSIVRRIIEKLGGQVGIESDPGSGSVFSFTLPKAV
jgi:PAS domain S-box-containing protein